MQEGDFSKIKSVKVFWNVFGNETDLVPGNNRINERSGRSCSSRRFRKVPVTEMLGQAKWHILKLRFSFSPSGPGNKLPIKRPFAFVSPPLGRFCENRSPRGGIQGGRGGSLPEHWRHGGDVRLPLLPDRAGPRGPPRLCPRSSVCGACPCPAGDGAWGWRVSRTAAPA